MKLVLKEIASRQTEFENLPLFLRLDMSRRLQDAMIFVPGMAFFVLTFQDILRLNEAKIIDPLLKQIAQHHRQEDLGHDHWFLNDLNALNFPCDVARLFGDEFQVTRDISFEIVSEIFQASDDRVRIVLPLALEAMGHVLFNRAHAFFARSGCPVKLKYFSKEHLQIELDHQLFDTEIDDRIQSIELSPVLRAEAIAMVNRAFDAVTRMVNYLDQQIVENDRELELLWQSSQLINASTEMASTIARRPATPISTPASRS